MIGRNRPSSAALVVLATLGLANLGAFSAYAAGLRMNTTASMPLGVYRLQPYSSGPIARDSLVAVCPSRAIRAVALPREYLRPGICPGNVEPLLKHVAAVGGDSVDVSDRAVRVNGYVLPRSARLPRDCAGRPLGKIAPGRYTMATDRLWLYAPVARSWDSRYFGPQAVSNVVGIATPLLIVGEGRTCAAER